MMRLNTLVPFSGRNDDDGDLHGQAESSPATDSISGPLDELISDLESQPKVMSEWSVRSRSAQADDADPEDTGARELASRFAPGRKPRVKFRRRRNPRQSDDRWALPEDRDVPDILSPDIPSSEHGSGSRDGLRSEGALFGQRQNLIKGMGAGVLLVAVIIAAIGLAGPWTSFLSDRTAGVSGKPGVRRTDNVDILAEIEKVRRSVESGAVAAKPDTPAETAAARLVPEITVTPGAQTPSDLPATEGGADGNGSEDRTFTVANAGSANPGTATVTASLVPEITVTPTVAAPSPPTAADDENAGLSGSSATIDDNAPGPDRDVSNLASSDAAADGTRDAVPVAAKNEDRMQLSAPSAQAEPETTVPSRSAALSTGSTDGPVTGSIPDPAVEPIGGGSSDHARDPGTGSARGYEPASDAAQPTELQMPPELIESLLVRGEKLLRSGNITPARMVFLRVADAGDPRGARGVGMTYDPEVYARLAVTGLQPNREQAEAWYGMAGEDSEFMTLAESPAIEPDTPAAAAEKAEEASEAETRNAACARKYRSFDPKTGLYKSYSGVMRPCRLP